MIPKNEDENSLLSSIVYSIEELKAVDINILDLRGIENTLCDYFLICNGTSNTHVSAIANSIQRHVSKQIKRNPKSVEGLENATWVLIDYIDIIVHVFQPEEREFYNLDSFWADAKKVETKV